MGSFLSLVVSPNISVKGGLKVWLSLAKVFQKSFIVQQKMHVENLRTRIVMLCVVELYFAFYMSFFFHVMPTPVTNHDQPSSSQLLSPFLAQEGHKN